MRCDEFEIRLNTALDERRNPAADRLLTRHADGCRHCRNLAAAMELIGESLRWSEPAEPDAALSERVLADLATTTPAASQPWSVWTHVSLAAAAALLVTLVMRPDEQARPQRPVVAQTVLPPETEVAQLDVRPALPVGELAREATSHYATLARSTQDSLAEVWSLWQPRHANEPDLASQSEATAAPLLAEMAAGLRPFAESTSGAMSFLLNVLPRGETPEPAPAAPNLDPLAGQTAT
jgi:hypothetical protein